MLATYQKLCTEFYDLQEHKNHVLALDFFRKKAHACGGRILEPMCGSGRFLIPLFLEGLDIEGFDASPAMIATCTENFARMSREKPPISLQLLQNFTSEKRYNLIVIPYGSWGLITDMRESEEGLMRLYEQLEDGGTLLLEIETTKSVAQQLGIMHRQLLTRSNGSFIALNAIPIYDKKTQLFEAFCRYESIINGAVQEVEEENFSQYLYRYNELDVLLTRAGFSQIKKYPAYDEAKIVDNSTPIIIYECIKQRE